MVNLFEIRLIGEPESNKQRACEVLLFIFTSTVGNKIALFGRKMEVSEVTFDTGFDDGFPEAVRFEVVGGESDREREEVEEEDTTVSLSNLGCMWRSVWWNFLHVLQPCLVKQVPFE